MPSRYAGTPTDLPARWEKPRFLFHRSIRSILPRVSFHIVNGHRAKIRRNLQSDFHRPSSSLVATRSRKYSV